MNSLQCEIENCLKTTTSLDTKDFAVSDVQHIKESIQSVFTSQMKHLQIREKWLLNQVDTVHQCLEKMSKKTMDQLAQTRGKLLFCLELMEELGSNEVLQKHAASLLKIYKRLLAQDLRHSNSKSPITFEYNDLSSKIQNFGVVHCKEEDSCSDDSWEYPESENSLSEFDFQDKYPDGRCTGCCGANSGKSQEIEDIDQMFGVKLVEEVCRANEICSSHSKCICDEPCYFTSSHIPTAVLDIESAVEAILAAPEPMAPKIPAVTVDCVDSYVAKAVHNSAEEQFQNQIKMLENQFAIIMSEPHAPMTQAVSKPWSVEEVSAVIDGILNEQAPNKTDDFPLNSKSHIGYEKKSLIVMDEKSDQEKSEFDFTKQEVKWTTVDSMHDILANILQD